MFETIFWIITAFLAAVWFFSLLEGWADINNRIEEGTSAEEHDEWPT